MEVCGWLSIEGIFFPCKEYEHIAAARILLLYAGKEKEALGATPDEALLQEGYLKCYRNSLALGQRNGQWYLTKAQEDWLNQQKLSWPQERQIQQYLSMVYR